MANLSPRQQTGTAVLQIYNNEMVKCIEDLCARRDELNKQIEEDHQEKVRLHNDLRILSDRLAKTNEGIAQRTSSLMELDKTIVDVQSAYSRLIDTSQSLLHAVQSANVELKMKEAVAAGNKALLKLPKTGSKRELVSKKLTSL